MRRPLCFLVFAMLAAGCASPQPVPSHAAPPVTPEPLASARGADGVATLEEAEAELEQARRELEASTATLGVARAPAASAGAAPPAPEAAPGSERDFGEASKPKKRQAADDAADGNAEQAESRAPEPAPCLTPCKAFASLVRAKDAVCRLDEPNGARCRRAESIVREAESRIASCACEP